MNINSITSSLYHSNQLETDFIYISAFSVYSSEVSIYSNVVG